MPSELRQIVRLCKSIMSLVDVLKKVATPTFSDLSLLKMSSNLLIYVVRSCVSSCRAVCLNNLQNLKHSLSFRAYIYTCMQNALRQMKGKLRVPKLSSDLSGLLPAIEHQHFLLLIFFVYDIGMALIFYQR